MRRRKFLLISGSALLASGIGLTVPLSARGAAKGLPRLTGTLSKAAFLAYIEQHFWVSDQTHRVIDLTLVAVTDNKPRPDHQDFTLTFLGPLRDPLPAGTYDFEHTLSGRFQLYIEPLSELTKGRYYRADLSLLT
jgi:hypothetical protein